MNSKLTAQQQMRNVHITNHKHLWTTNPLQLSTTLESNIFSGSSKSVKNPLAEHIIWKSVKKHGNKAELKNENIMMAVIKAELKLKMLLKAVQMKLGPSGEMSLEMMSKAEGKVTRIHLARRRARLKVQSQLCSTLRIVHKAMRTYNTTNQLSFRTNLFTLFRKRSKVQMCL